MVEIGATLKKAREEREISLAEVEEAIKIKRFYLEALEKEEFEELPGLVYAVGFLKNYARYLKLESSEIAELTQALKDRLSSSTNNNVQSEAKKVRVNRPGRSIIFLVRQKIWPLATILIIVALLVFLMALGIMGDQMKNPTSTITTNVVPNNMENSVGPSLKNETSVIDNTGNNTENTINNSVDNANEEAPGLEVKKIKLKLVANKGNCWMSIKVDGKEVFSGTLQQGEERTFFGKEKIFIHLGNAGGVEVIKNGESLGYIGEWRKVAKREFTAEGV